MPTTWEAAYTVLTNALIAGVVGMGTDAGLDADPTLRFAGVEKGEIPDAPFMRWNMNPVLERQATFRTGGADKSQRYRITGAIIIQCFVPRRIETGEEGLRRMATATKLLFRGTQFDGCVWARNVRVNKLDPEPKYLRANVVMEYEYDEVG